MIGNPKIKDQDMTKHKKLIDHFTKVNDNYTVTNCQNGYIVEVSGQDSSNEWITVKYVFKAFEELTEAVQDLAWMPRT